MPVPVCEKAHNPANKNLYTESLCTCKRHIADETRDTPVNASPNHTGCGRTARYLPPQKVLLKPRRFSFSFNNKRAFSRRTRRSMLFLAEDEDCRAGCSTLDGHCRTEYIGGPPGLEHLPEDVLLALMSRLDGESLACFGRTAKPFHAASSQIPPLIFASRGRLVIFRSSPPRRQARLAL